MVIELEQWMPMPIQMGPPLPKSMQIYWPWYTPEAPPEVIYACPYCPAEFPTEQELYDHIRTAHPAQPPQIIYMCPYCGAKFSTMSALQAHITAVHPPAPPPVVYACPYCPATFATEAQLAYHIETVHPAAPPPPPPPPPPGVADIRVENLTIEPSEVYVGETVQIGVIARNYGDASGSKVITGDVNGKVSKQTVALGSGESRSVTFDATPQQAKTYRVSVNGLTGSFSALKAPPAIGFKVTLINCPTPTRPDGVAKFNDGTGAWVPCGQAGSWPFDADKWRPFPFTFYVHEWVEETMYERLAFYSFSETVENGKDYIYDCRTGQFSER